MVRLPDVAGLRYAIRVSVPTIFNSEQQYEGNGMSMKRLVVMVMGLVLAASGALAAEADAVSVTWRELWRAPAPVTLPIEAEPASTTVSFPGPELEDGESACLRFRAHLTAPQDAGWNNYLALTLNGMPLDARTESGEQRIVNRRGVFETRSPRYPMENLVKPRAGLPCLQVFFGPREPQLNEILTDREEGYWYLLYLGDIGLGWRNELTITNTAIAEYWNGAPPEGMRLIIEELAVGAVPSREIRALQAESLVKRRPLSGLTLPGEGDSVRINSSGGMRIDIAGESYYFETSFSFPQDGGMGFNELNCKGEIVGEPTWKPEAKAGQYSVEIMPESTGDESGDEDAPEPVTVSRPAMVLTAEGASYRIERTIRRPLEYPVRPEGVPKTDEGPWFERTRRCIMVTDTITNKTDEVLGLAVKHELITPEFPKEVKLGGLDVPGMGLGQFPENPTVYAAQERSGIGITPEDNLMRLQQERLLRENALSFGTERLGLKPGESYTLKLAVYPVETDYYTFINALRADWDVNFTVDGPWDFFDVRNLATEEGRQEAAAMARRKGLKYFALTPWFEYYNGWDYSRDEYKQMMTGAKAFIQRINPSAKCLACVETNLVPVPLSFFGGAIPEDFPVGRDAGGKYGQKGTPGMTAHVDASVWRDSVLRDADGSVLVDCWYVQHYTNKRALNLMVYPTLDNYRHKDFLEQAAFLLDDVGLDGLYIDQFSLAWAEHPQRYNKAAWDGRTVILDENGRVAGQWMDLGLVSAAARRVWVQTVLDRGKTVVCNTLPAVFELQSLPTFRFMETQGYDPMAGEVPYMDKLAKGQLGSPIGLGHSFPADAGADFFMRTVIAHLRFGQLYYYYFTQFPPRNPDADGDGVEEFGPEEAQIINGRVAGEFGPLKEMFPFTPRELHEGWVLGEDKLITAVPGEFPWPYDRTPRVKVFNQFGLEIDADAQVKYRGGTYSIQISLDDWRQVAVVE